MSVYTSIHTRAQNSGGTSTDNCKAFVQEIDARLTQAGWTRTWANNDFSQGGTLPAMAYLMPQAGLTNRWAVRFDFSIAGGGSVDMAVTTGKAVDGAGVVAGASPARGLLTLVPGAGGNDTVVVASEYGFATVMWCNGSFPSFLAVERRRNISNTYTDDLLVAGTAFSGSGTGWVSNNGVRNIVRNWTVGEYAEQGMAYLAGAQNAVSYTPSTLSTSDGNVGYPMGLFSTSGGLGGALRLVQVWATGDAVPGADQSIEVDGASRLYYCLNVDNVAGFPASVRLLVARQ